MLHLLPALGPSFATILVNMPLNLKTAVFTITKPCRIWIQPNPKFNSSLPHTPKHQWFNLMGHTNPSGTNNLLPSKILPYG